jgi:hypothetical protein
VLLSFAHDLGIAQVILEPRRPDSTSGLDPAAEPGIDLKKGPLLFIRGL